MTQYIDKDVLVAEIEKRIKETESMQPKFDQFLVGQISAFKGILKIIDTIEVKEDDVCGVHVEDAIAWIEKQGKETSWKPSKEEMDVLYGLAYITNKYDEHKEEVITRLYQDLKREFFNGSSYENMFPNTENDVRRRSTIQVLEYAKSLDNYNQYGKADIDKNIAWLEKQGKEIAEENIKYEDMIIECYDCHTVINFHEDDIVNGCYVICPHCGEHLVILE